MIKTLQELREGYFLNVCANVQPYNGCLIILTHLLQDRPELIRAINTISPVALIIGIPYSVHKPTKDELSQSFNVVTPTLVELKNANYLTEIIYKTVSERPFIILEIGGYFAPVVEKINQKMPNQLLGIVEDTETGHRAYEANEKLSCPIVSVARSPLKDPEDFLIGSSCLYSTEKIVRTMGFPIEGKSSLVLGFGKIGRGLSHALLRKQCPVSVFDINPITRVTALSEGFCVPEKRAALKKAEIIYGATGKTSLKGEDFSYLRDRCFLVSCSSKEVEFDLSYLKQNYIHTPIFDGLDEYKNGDKVIYLLAKGTPVNFLDGAVVGPVLALVQSEIIIAIKMLTESFGRRGIIEVEDNLRTYLASKWIEHFCDLERGYYHFKQNLNTLVAA